MGGVQESNGSNTTVGPTRGGCRDSKMGQPLCRDRHPADMHGWTNTGPSEKNLSAETTTSNNAEPTTHTSSSLTQHGTTKIPKPSNDTTHPKQPYNNTHTGLTNPLQRTPDTNRNLRMSPVTGTEAMPMGRMQGTACNQFMDWDRQNPYPKTTEGKVAYEAAIQAWWERNGFNGRANVTDLIPLMPGTLPVGTNECYACGRNDQDNPCFPHHSSK